MGAKIQISLHLLDLDMYLLRMRNIGPLDFTDVLSARPNIQWKYKNVCLIRGSVSLAILHAHTQ